MDIVAEGLIMDIDMECSGDIHRNSCSLLESEIGERDALSAARMMVSLLSILGASAIIANIIKRKLIWTPTIHPIFQLSIADWLLGILWVVGACLWFRGTSERTWCFLVSLLTVILECVTANLTLVYAIVAYSALKMKQRSNVVEQVYAPSSQIWHPVTSVLVYLTAWIFPSVVVLSLFGILAARTSLVSDANSCSCWCFPYLGNVLPYSAGRDLPSAQYVQHIRKLVLAYSVVLLLNFLIVFVIISVLYWKILKEIKNIRNKVAELDNDLINTVVKKSHLKARKRIVHFILVFLIISLSIVILCLLVIYNECHALLGDISTDQILHTTPQHKVAIIIHLLQSITVPLQGFLNSIVYGRTRDDFIDVMDSTGRFKETGENNEKLLVTLKGGLETNSEDGQSELYSRSLSSASQEDEGISEDSDG